MSELTRRQFMKVTGMSLVGSSLALMGFSPEVALAEVREYKLSRATETRNTCPYCSVACGILMYSLGDGAKNAKFHWISPPAATEDTTLHIRGSSLASPRTTNLRFFRVIAKSKLPFGTE